MHTTPLELSVRAFQPLKLDHCLMIKKPNLLFQATPERHQRASIRSWTADRTRSNVAKNVEQTQNHHADLLFRSPSILETVL